MRTGAFSHALAPLVVDTDDGAFRRAWAVEEERLRVEVVLHRRVEVEVILAQVAKAGCRKARALDAAQGQRVGRDLHDDVRHALVAHKREELLELRCLRRGELRRHRLAINPRARRANEPHRVARMQQARLQQVARGRLSRGTRNTDDSELVRGMSVDLRSNGAEDSTDVVDDEQRTGLPCGLQDVATGGIGKNGGRLRLRGVLGSMGAGARQRGEETASGDGARVEAHGVNDGRAVAFQSGLFQAWQRQKLLYSNAHNSYGTLSFCPNRGPAACRVQRQTLPCLLPVVLPLLLAEHKRLGFR